MTFAPSRETLQAGERLLSGPRPAVTGPYELLFRSFLKAEEGSTERLMSFYMQARLEIGDYIGNLLGQVPQVDLEHYRELQAGLDVMLGELDAGAAKWADESAAAAYAAGKGLSGTPDFTTIHDEAVKALARGQLDLITNTSNDIRRSIQQEVSQAIIGSIRGPELVARIMGTGLAPGPWKTLEERAGVIARTETMRAFNAGNMAGITESGAHLVQWITSEDEAVCKVCGPRDGEIYRIGSTVPKVAAPAKGDGWDAPSIDPAAEKRAFARLTQLSQRYGVPVKELGVRSTGIGGLGGVMTTGGGFSVMKLDRGVLEAGGDAKLAARHQLQIERNGEPFNITGDTLEGLITHEFGHAVHDAVGRQEGDRFVNENIARLRRLRGFSGRLTTSLKDAPGEVFAELFAAADAGRDPLGFSEWLSARLPKPSAGAVGIPTDGLARADVEWLAARPALADAGGAPPAHPRCRCTIAAHFRGPNGQVIGDPGAPAPDVSGVKGAIADEMPSRAMSFDDELASLKSGEWRGVRGGLAVDAPDPVRVRFWRKHPPLTQGQLERIADDIDLTREFVLARYGVNVNLGEGLRGARGAVRKTPTKGGTLFKKNAELRLRMLEGWEAYHRAGAGRYVSPLLPDEMDETARALVGTGGGIGRNKYLHQVQVHGTFRRGALADMSDTGTMRWDAVTAAAKYVKPGSHVRHGGTHAGATGTHVHEIGHAIGNMFGNPKYLGSSQRFRLFGKADSVYGHNAATIEELTEEARERMWTEWGAIRTATAKRGFTSDAIGGAGADAVQQPGQLAMMRTRLEAAKTRTTEIRRLLDDSDAFEASFAERQREAARLLQRPPDRESYREFLRHDLARERSFESTYQRAVDAMEKVESRTPPAAGDPDYWPTDYAQTNLWEDFAETISLYLLNAERLREWSPARFAFMRRYVFPEVAP